MISKGIFALVIYIDKRLRVHLKRFINQELIYET